MNLSSVIHTRECGHSTDCLFRICNASAVHISIDLQCIYETFTFANWSPQAKGDFLKRRCLHHPVFVLPEKQSRDLAHPLRILFLDVFFPAEVKRASAQKPGPNCRCRRFPSSLQWETGWLRSCPVKITRSEVGNQLLSHSSWNLDLLISWGILFIDADQIVRANVAGLDSP